MKFLPALMALLLFIAPAWADEGSTAEPALSSTLYMSLEDVLAQQAKEKAAQEAARKNTGLPPAAPIKTPHRAGFTEKLVSGFVKGAARQEALNNPDRDLRPRPEPVNRNAFSR